jgi:hypothetical protein
MTDGCGIRVARRSRRARVRDGRPHWQGRRRPFLPISSTASKAGSTDGRLSSYIDEGWLALDDTSFAQPLREWLKTLRRKNASVIFATQSLADIETSAIAPALVESCPTRIFLPKSARSSSRSRHLSAVRIERPESRSSAERRRSAITTPSPGVLDHALADAGLANPKRLRGAPEIENHEQLSCRGEFV